MKVAMRSSQECLYPILVIGCKDIHSMFLIQLKCKNKSKETTLISNISLAFINT